MPIWRPSTCQCRFRIASDGQATPALQEVLERCSSHASLSDANAYAAACDDCRRVSYSIVEALEAEGISRARENELVNLEGEAQRLGIPLSFLTTPAQQQDLVRMKEIQDAQWSFDASRLLRISFPKTDAAQKTAIQARVDTRFGPGRVKVA